MLKKVVNRNLQFLQSYFRQSLPNSTAIHSAIMMDINSFIPIELFNDNDDKNDDNANFWIALDKSRFEDEFLLLYYTSSDYDLQKVSVHNYV